MESDEREGLLGDATEPSSSTVITTMGTETSSTAYQQETLSRHVCSRYQLCK